MKPDNHTYKEIYDGRMIMPRGQHDPEDHSSPVYWDEDISYEITKSNKFELDRPTILIGIPIELLGIQKLTTEAADYCLRAFKPYIDELNEDNDNRKRTDEENGKYYIYAPNGTVLIRNACYFKIIPRKYYIYLYGTTIRVPDELSKNNPAKMCINIMVQVQLPHNRHKKSATMLTKDLPGAVKHFINGFNACLTEQLLDKNDNQIEGMKHHFTSLEKVYALYEKQEQIRTWLKTSPYCAFIADGSILPRLKGSDYPLLNAQPFKSAPEHEIEICGIRGMGIKRGITVITGGGYSGKSTLLDAISEGVYNHIEGDGRELVITDDTAMKISAEDGRSIKNTNISPFIKWLPSGNTNNFSTEHASGSTSQAANIMEAVDYGTKLLLIDEDKSATNFMIRDKVMKELIKHEPITPFTDRVRELYEKQDVSTILVIGGSGEYLSVADNIYMMDEFKIYDAKTQSKELCEKYDLKSEPITSVDWKNQRQLLTEKFTSYPKGSGTEKLMISDMGFIFIGDERIDVRMLHNIATFPQLNAIGFIIRKMQKENKEIKIKMDEMVSAILEKLKTEGLDSAYTNFFTDCSRWLDMPRKHEVMAVINRMREPEFYCYTPLNIF